MTLSVGETVFLSEEGVRRFCRTGWNSPHNPQMTSGVITQICSTSRLPVRVLWATGRQNIYKEEHLFLTTGKPPSLEEYL